MPCTSTARRDGHSGLVFGGLPAQDHRARRLALRVKSPLAARLPRPVVSPRPFGWVPTPATTMRPLRFRCNGQTPPSPEILCRAARVRAPQTRTGISGREGGCPRAERRSAATKTRRANREGQAKDCPDWKVLGRANDRCWLDSEVRATSPVRPLYPREPTFERRLPLFDPFLLLHLQVRTILTVPPLDCC